MKSQIKHTNHEVDANVEKNTMLVKANPRKSVVCFAGAAGSLLEAFGTFWSLSWSFPDPP